LPITITDVATRAGVSKTTVSRVLNGKGELDAATAARVRQVIAELGYVPKAGAVGLARGRTRVIGMLAPLAHLAVDRRGAAGHGGRGRVGGLRPDGVHLHPGRPVDAALRQPGLGEVLRRAAGHRARGHPGLHQLPARAGPAGGADRRPGAPAALPVRGDHQPGRRRLGGRAPALARAHQARRDHRRGALGLHPRTARRIPHAAGRGRASAGSAAGAGRGLHLRGRPARDDHGCCRRASSSTPSSRTTTCPPRARCRPSARRSCGCRRTWRWSGSTTCRWPRTRTRR
jgi:hypothetical protein